MEEPRTQTSVGMETVDETVNRARQMQQPNTDIPVEAIESDVQGVRLPTQPEMSDTVAGARTAAEQVIGDFQRDTEAREAQTRERVDEGEQAILESLGVLGTQRQTQQELRSDAGLPEMQTQTRDITNRIRAASRELQEFADETFFRREQRRDELMGVDAPSAVFNAEQRAFTIQREMQRRQKAANVRTDIAVLETLQGNMEAAERQVQAAMDAIYEPIKTELQMEQFMLERNSQRFSAAQQQASQARMMGVQRQLQDIDYARDEVSQVVKLGYASDEEIRQIMETDDVERQIEMARSIHGRGAAEERRMNQRLQQAQLDQIYHSMAPAPAEDSNRQLSIDELKQLNSMGYNLPVGSTMNDAMEAGVTPGVGTGEPSEFARMVVDNPSLLEDLTPTERGNVLREVADAGGQFQTAAQQSAENITQAALEQLEELKDDARGRRSASGIRGLTYYIPGSRGRTWEARLETLKAQLALPQLEFLSGLGRMTQEQYNDVRNSVATLETRELSNRAMADELDKLEETLKDVLSTAGTRGSGSLPQQTSDDDYQQYLNTLGQ